MSSGSKHVFPVTLVKFNLYYHYVAFMFIPVLALFPFSIYFLYPLLPLAFIGPALPLTVPLVINVYIVLGKHYSVTIYALSYLSWFIALFLVVASYFLYKGTLKRRESRRWPIALPIIWAYPVPIMIYTVAACHKYFLKALTGEEVFRSYHFPGAIERMMTLIFIGLFIAVTYTAINIYTHIMLVKNQRTHGYLSIVAST